jgi:tRNA modification GTPase
MLDRLDSIVVAVSSAPGAGPVGLVRLSGPGAADLVGRFVHTDSGQALSATPGGRRIAGRLELEPGAGLPVELYVFRAPNSFTREDLVEIHTIGATAVLDAVRQKMLRHGAAAAGPGEFTARAFLNGAMDLTAAEAVAATIRARTDVQLRAARHTMAGTLAGQLRQARDELAELLALVEADIDFAEEPIEFISPNAASTRLGHVLEQLGTLVSGTVPTERLAGHPHVLLLGPPNAGKSTLMNRLTGTSRAICAAVAGTTRDILSAPVRLGRGEAVLLDAAGIDESQDEILRAARAQALAAAERVDAVCLVVDVSRRDLHRIHAAIVGPGLPPVVVAANKIDVVSRRVLGEALRCVMLWHLGPVVPVCAENGEGVEELRRALASTLSGQLTTTSGEVTLVSERQRGSIAAAEASLTRGMELVAGTAETIDCADLLAFELREALDAIGSVSGEVTTDDLLGQVFARFCIGK